MKKNLIGIFAIGLLTLTSCKKDYTCDCSITTTMDYGTVGLDPVVTTADVSTPLNDYKKKDAEEACTTLDENSTTSSAMGMTTTSDYSCTLK